MMSVLGRPWAPTAEPFRDQSSLVIDRAHQPATLLARRRKQLSAKHVEGVSGEPVDGPGLRLCLSQLSLDDTRGGTTSTKVRTPVSS